VSRFGVDSRVMKQMTGTALGRVTIRDVAHTAGVSVTTVSHALNGKGQIRAETREHIRGVAARLGYRPSRAAQALRRSRTGTIALILPSDGSQIKEREMISLDYYMSIASASAQGAFGYGYSLVLPPRLADAEEWGVLAPDGVILCDPATRDDRIDTLEGLGTPVVSIERDSGRPERTYYVAGDNDANMVAMLDHLDRSGARRIALLWAESSWAWTLDGRRAYERWCSERGCESLVTPVSLRDLESDAYRASSQLLGRRDRPDAVVASAERYAEGVLRACKDHSLGVPDDVMVISGIDNHELRRSAPSVSAIDIDPTAQALAAIEMLHARIEGQGVDQPRIVPSELHVRQSPRR